MKKVEFQITIALLLFCISPLLSQKGDLSTPEATVRTLFKAMHDGDSTIASQVFAENATLNSVFTTKTGEQMVKEGDVAGFIDAIGTPHEEVWDERISNLSVKMDGDLAHAWMDYSFYLGSNFSHCGVNAMHLVRKDEEWKILQIVDTRRKKDCN